MRLQEPSGQPRTCSCREALATLSRLLDGELEGISAERLQAHLVGCAACSAEAAKQKRLAETIREPWPAERNVQFPSGAELLRRVRLPQAAARTWLPPRLLPHAGWAVAATLVLLVAGSRLYHHAGPTLPRSASVNTVEPPLPSLVVLDDEREGRRVILGSATAPGARGIGN